MYAAHVVVVRVATTVAKEKNATVVDTKREVLFAVSRERQRQQRVLSTASRAGTRKVPRRAAMTNVRLAHHVDCIKDHRFAAR